MPVLCKMLSGCETVLDPFAGTGKIHDLPYKTTGVEIEPEWAMLHKNTEIGDATCLRFDNESFDAVCTSPTYGNRMADSHEAKDGSKRNTYTHTLGRKLSDNNSGKMQWGDEYKALHTKAWGECFRVLKNGGVFILNIKNHIRKGREVDVYGWHKSELERIGFVFVCVEEVECAGNRFGDNSQLRTGIEYVAKFIKLPKKLDK